MIEPDIEVAIWRRAHAVFPEAMLTQLISQALMNYKRAPGLDHEVRLHASQIGTQALRLLQEALSEGMISQKVSGASFVTLRYQVSQHIARALQWRLVQSGHADEVVVEDQFARDLGL